MIAIAVSIQGRHFAAILSSDTGDSTGDTSDSSGAGTGSTSSTTATLVVFAVAAAVLVVLVLQRLSRKQPPSTTFVLRKLLALEQNMRCSRCSRSRYSTSFCALFASLSLAAAAFVYVSPSAETQQSDTSDQCFSEIMFAHMPRPAACPARPQPQRRRRHCSKRTCGA